MPRYKRSADDALLDHPVEPAIPPEHQETLTKLRNMWEFASLMQYIFLFGHVVKIEEDFDIEDLEAESLKPSPSEKLARIGLQLLKYVSSHRGLTPEIFDEYTRRQYLAKAPQRNPFGDDEDPINFNDLDIFTRIKVLQQLSTWTLGNADRIRGMMSPEEDHLNWRMEPLGWDKEDRSYFVLDDNRLYRRTDDRLPPPNTPKPKTKSKAKAKAKSAKSSKSRATRASKRRKVEDSEDEEIEEQSDGKDLDMDDTTMMTANGDQSQDEEPGYGFTNKTWECIAITLEEYQDFMASVFRSRDPNEKALRARIEEDVLPIIEKRAEALRQKQQKKMRDLENLQKIATAKRSSRLAGKAEKEKQEREEREAEEKRQADLRMAREEQERQKRIEEGHESRRLTREQRVREREAKRILHEEELARLEAEEEPAEPNAVDTDAGDAKRASERQRITQREQHKKELEKLAEDEGNWYFDCSVCGKHGENMDDGTHSIACDRCNVWQHSKCHGFSPKQAESSGFTFVCATCKRKEADANKPKIPPLKLSNRTSGSPEAQKNASRPNTANGLQTKQPLPDHITQQLNGLSSNNDPRPSPGPFGQITAGPSLSPYGQRHGPPGYRYPPVSNFAQHSSPQNWQGSPHPPPGYAQSGYGRSPSVSNGYGGPPQHQQQHHYAHQGAVASAGGHSTHYQPPYASAAPSNGHNSSAPAGVYYQQHPYQSQPHQQYGQHHPQYQQSSQQQSQQPPRPGSGHMTNGFHSPEKVTQKPSPAPQNPTWTQAPTQQPAQQPRQSPKPRLPPPFQPQHQRAQSPTKPSPSPIQQQPPSIQPHYSPNPRLEQPSPANGFHTSQPTYPSNQFQTPQPQRLDNHTGVSHTSAVAADGMSGPWPEGSKAIPQKHDQSPAPPSSAHEIGERKVFPPNTPLVPSPRFQATGSSSVPVKKDLSPTSIASANMPPPQPPQNADQHV